MKKRNSIMRRIASFMLVLVICGSMMILPTAAKGSAAAEAASAVVRIVVMNPLDGSVAGTGSAFGIAAKENEAPQYFVTNWHVINPEVVIDQDEAGKDITAPLAATQIYIMKSDQAVTANYVQGRFVVESSQLIPCEVVYEGAEYPDMAILRAAEPFAGRTNLPLRLPDEQRDRGQTVYALGYPGVNDNTNLDTENFVQPYPADVEDVSITQGVFSHMAAMKTFDNYVHIEHDARIHGGNSGGPLIDKDGYVIGINTYTITADDTSIYSVSSQYVMSKCDELNIPYRTEGGSGMNTVVIIAVAAAAVALVVVIMVLAVRKNKKKAEQIPVPPVAPAAPAGLKIYAQSGVFAGNTFTITAATKFGRNVSGVCFPENTAGVSGEHCQIYHDNVSGQFCLVDLNSTYGTYVNNQKIAPNVPVQLQTGITFYLGSQEQTFRVM